MLQVKNISASVRGVFLHDVELATIVSEGMVCLSFPGNWPFKEDADLEIRVLRELAAFLQKIGAVECLHEGEPVWVLYKRWNRYDDSEPRGESWKLESAVYRIHQDAFETKDDMVVRGRVHHVFAQPKNWNPRPSELGIDDE